MSVSGKIVGTSEEDLTLPDVGYRPVGQRNTGILDEGSTVVVHRDAVILRLGNATPAYRGSTAIDIHGTVARRISAPPNFACVEGQGRRIGCVVSNLYIVPVALGRRPADCVL